MTERMNMLRVAVPERAEEGRPFDPEKEIPPEKWKEIEAEWEDLQRGIVFRPEKLSVYAMHMRLLRPGSPNIPKEDWPTLEHILGERRQAAMGPNSTSADRMDYLQEAVRLRVLDPSRPVLDGTDRDFIQLEADVARGDIRDEFKARALARIVLAQESRGEQRDWETTLLELESCRKHDDWEGFLHLATWMKIRRPREMALVPSDWKALRVVWKKSANIKEYLLQAAVMKILAAEDIKITKEKGLELIMPTGEVDGEKSPQQPAMLDV